MSDEVFLPAIVLTTAGTKSEAKDVCDLMIVQNASHEIAKLEEKRMQEKDLTMSANSTDSLTDPLSDAIIDEFPARAVYFYFIKSINSQSATTP